MRRLIPAVFVALFSCAACASDFLHTVIYPTGGTGVATGIFTASGKPDVVVCNGTALDLYVNSGAGALKPPVSFPITNPCNQLIVADMNHDGKADVIAYPRDGDTIEIVLGNGDGTFQAARRYHSNSDPQYSFEGKGGVAVGDLDGDGNLDVVVLLGIASQLVVLKGSSTGVLQAPKLVAFGCNCWVSQIALADLNRDGKLDIVGVGWVALGNGDGTFQSPAKFTTAVSVTGNNRLDSLLVADFDNDGKVDIALVDIGGGIFLLPGNGDGTLKPEVKVAAFSPTGYVYSVAAIAADFDGDGNADIAVGFNSPDGFFVLRGRGDGTFDTTTLAQYLPGRKVGAMATADLTGNGRLDVITDGGDWEPLAVLLRDTGSVGVEIQPGALAFSVDAAAAAPVQAVNITSIADSPLNISGVTIDPPFSEVDNCTGSLAKGQSCGIAIMFAPSLAGTYSGHLTLMDNTGLGKEVVSITGVFTLPVVQLSTSLLTFGNQKIGTISTPQKVVVTNPNSAPVTVSAATGAYGSFIQTSSCVPSSPIPPGGLCEVNVYFNPIGPGLVAGTLEIGASLPNAGINRYSVMLTGAGFSSGAVVQVSPPSLSFGSQFAGTSGAPMTALVANTGDLPATIKSVTTSVADFAALSTCGSTVQPGQSCSVGVFFSPKTSGSKTGQLTVTDGNGSHTVALDGAGADITVAAAPGSSTSQTVAAGQSTSYSLSFTPQYFTGTVTLSCTGTPQGVTCTPSPATLTVSGPASVAVNVTTTSRTISSAKPGRHGFPWQGVTLAVMSLAVIGRGLGGKKQRSKLMLALALSGILAWTSCGGGTLTTTTSSTSQQSVNPNGTPSGSYTMTLNISASTTMAKTAPLTLNVQ